jgi:adenylylsulfate kinase-like enzyme
VSNPIIVEELWLTCFTRSGKSSIANVVFHKLPPSETLFLETTYRIKKESMQ